MRKGYILVVLFSLSVAILQSLKYRIFMRRDLSEATLTNLVLQVITLLLLLLIPGLLAVRWYYKKKNK